MNDYAYRGARALVLLHERHMREFLPVWKRAKAAAVPLPATEDTSYESLETLLRHVLRAARGYMNWFCRVLDLPDPEIRPAPSAETVEVEAEAYLEHLLECWREPLASVTASRFEDRTYESDWGGHYSIDSMLEHAVIHPIRHSFQLEELLQEAKA